LYEYADDIEDASDGHGKEGRRLFEPSPSHRIGNRLRKCGNSILGKHRSNGKKEFLLLASIFLSSNLMVGLLVYRYMLTAETTQQSLLTSMRSSAIMSSCPRDMTGFANWFANTLDSKRKASFKDLRIDLSSQTKTKSFAPVPAEHYKTFYFDGKKISQPIARALRSRGWRKVDDTDNAHLIYTYSNNADWAKELKPWQRFNHIVGVEKWNHKSEFAFYYKVFEAMTGKPPSVYVPETYMLTENKKEIEAFRKVLEEKNGNEHPWVHKLSAVNQGKGITILAPDSPQLMELPSKSLKDLRQKKETSGDEFEEIIVQRYICNEMTWNHRKFDVRMFWFVASLDPLIVLYHDGYVRVGNAVYSETTFEDTRSHLTSHTGLGAESKATFAEFEEKLNEQHEANTNTSRKQKPFPYGATPVEHVRNQFKHALGEMIEIMKDESFVVPDYDKKEPQLSAENAFNFYCADFIADKDLDIWFIEPQVRLVSYYRFDIALLFCASARLIRLVVWGGALVSFLPPVCDCF
jgi:hypothetical protein